MKKLSLLQFGYVLGIIPLYDKFNPAKFKERHCLYKCYLVVILALIFTGASISLWGRSSCCYKSFPSSTLVTSDVILNLSMTATNLCFIMAPTFWNFNHYKKFFEIFCEVNAIFKTQKVNTTQIKMFYLLLVVGHFVFLGLVVYYSYIWIVVLGYNTYKYYIFSNFQNYHKLISVIIICQFILSLWNGFKETNHKIKEAIELPNLGENATKQKTSFTKLKMYEEIQRTVHIYRSQISQITLFNRIFGWQILFLILSTISEILYALDFLTIYIFMGKSKGVFGLGLGTNLIALGTLWSFWQLVLCAAFIYTCNGALQEARRTSEICFDALFKLSTSENKIDVAIRDQLTLLNQLVINGCPPISAAGFFTVDPKLLLSIFSSVTSYVIVLIQFNKQ